MRRSTNIIHCLGSTAAQGYHWGAPSLRTYLDYRHASTYIFKHWDDQIHHWGAMWLSWLQLVKDEATCGLGPPDNVTYHRDTSKAMWLSQLQTGQYLWLGTLKQGVSPSRCSWSHHLQASIHVVERLINTNYTISIFQWISLSLSGYLNLM